MAIELTWEIIRIPLFVFATDVAMWFNWAIANDFTITKYEWRILVDRLIKFGVAGVLLALAGFGWDAAAAMAGLGVFGDAWVKSLTKEPAPVEPPKNFSTI